MPKNLKRLTGRGHLHFITFCCYQRRRLLASVRARNLVVKTLGEVRARFGFLLVGYVVMPDHVHLLVSESGAMSPAKIVQVLKQRVSRRMRGKKRSASTQLSLRFSKDDVELRRFWQRRYFDFNMYARAKVQEKLYYMHGNPVKAKLVAHPGDWPWSSWCDYYRRQGMLKMDSWVSQ
jgi:putative transposase